MSTQYIYGHEGYFGRGTQATIPTAVAATSFQSFTDLNLKIDMPNLKAVETNRKTRGKTAVIVDRTSVTGTANGQLFPDEIMQSIGFADLMGNYNSVSGSASIGYTHIFNEPRVSVPADFPSTGQTLEALMGGEDNTLLFQFIGSFMKSLELSIPEQGEITFIAEYVGKTVQTASASLSSPTYTSKNPFVSSNCDLQYGATISSTASIYQKSAKFKYDNMAEMIPGGNSATPSRVAFNGIPMINGDFTIDRTKDLIFYNYYIAGTPIALKYVITHTELIAGTTIPYSITIELPYVLLLGEAPAISGQGLQTLTIPFEAMQHPSLGYTCKITAVNSVSGTYTV